MSFIGEVARLSSRRGTAGPTALRFRFPARRCRTFAGIPDEAETSPDERVSALNLADRKVHQTHHRSGYETYFSARVWYSCISFSSNHTSISRLASPGLADACTRLATGSPLALA